MRTGHKDLTVPTEKNKTLHNKIIALERYFPLLGFFFLYLYIDIYMYLFIFSFSYVFFYYYLFLFLFFATLSDNNASVSLLTNFRKEISHRWGKFMM